MSWFFNAINSVSDNGKRGVRIFISDSLQGTIAHVVLFANLLDVIDDLKAESWVEPAGGFVEEEDLRISDKSTGNSKTLLLATTEPLLDPRTNDGVCLSHHAEVLQQIVDSSLAFLLGDRAVCCEYNIHYMFRAGSTYGGSASRAAKFIVSRTVRLPINASSCSTYAERWRSWLQSTDWPFVRMSPRVVAPAAAAQWASVLRRVVLHELEGPNMAIISPGLTSPLASVKIDNGDLVMRSLTVTFIARHPNV